MSIADAYTGSGGGLNEAHKGLESGRAGHDGIGPARTFHCNIGSVKVGESARASLDYIRRKGEHKGDAADVESEAGNPQAVLDDAGLIEASARIRRGANAERQLVTEVYELPADSTPENRKKVAEAVVADWRGRGHEAVAVVHMHGERTPQPHLHVAVASRPVDGAGNVDRSRRLLTGRDQIRDERAHVAEIVNRICEPEVRFHPGRLIDTGIERPARKRIPPGAFRKGRAEIRAANGAGEPDRARAAEASMYAVSAGRRLELHGRREARRVEIGALKAARRWPPKSQRQQLKDQAAGWKHAYEGRRARGATELAEAVAAARTEEQDTAKEDREALETELATAKKERGEWKENTLEIVKLAYEHAEVDLPDLGTDAGLAAAAEFLEGGAGRAEAVRAEEQEEAGRALTAAKTAWQDERAALAAERDNAKDRVAGLNARQTKFLTGVHREAGRDLPGLETEEGLSVAWAFARAEIEAGRAARREAAAEKKELEQPADNLLAFVSQAEIEKAEARRRKAEAKKAKRGEQSEKQQAIDEISEACKPVYRMWKQTGDKIGRAMADGGELAAAAEAYGQYQAHTLSLRKDATEEKLAGVLAAINASAARLGAETLKQPLTVEEAAAEHEKRRPKTPIEQLAEAHARTLAAEEEKRLRPAKELAAEKEARASWGQGWRSPAPASEKSRVQTPPRVVQPGTTASAASPNAEAGRQTAAQPPSQVYAHAGRGPLGCYPLEGHHDRPRPPLRRANGGRTFSSCRHKWTCCRLRTCIRDYLPEGRAALRPGRVSWTDWPCR